MASSDPVLQHRSHRDTGLAEVPGKVGMFSLAIAQQFKRGMVAMLKHQPCGPAEFQWRSGAQLPADPELLSDRREEFGGIATSMHELFQNDDIAPPHKDGSRALLASGWQFFRRKKRVQESVLSRGTIPLSPT
jgi:hypothetical protein